MLLSAVPGIEIACPAASLSESDVARRVVSDGILVSAVGGLELDAVLALGVAPGRIGVHCDDLTDDQILWAARMGIGRLVISSAHQADVLSSCAGLGLRGVWLQMGCGVSVLRGRPGLCIAGLEADCDGAECTAVVDNLMGELADIRWHALVGRLGISGLCLDRDAVDEIDDAVTEGCIRYRLPRPQLTLCSA
ncbi:hypothetical protein ACNO8X_26215 [Mycobacterium sp. PDNC021]|uniref:hypothetical protein n=1 Tax=Mycobacterium sp. PDNC021 TaxID=3391399 RepID=UPI003AAA2DDF